MKNKWMVTGVFLMFTLGIWFLTATPMNTQANEIVQLDMEQALQAGFVIVEGGRVNNILRLQDFAENVRNQIEDSITILENPGTNHVNAFELHYEEGSLRLLYDIQIAPSGRKEFRIREYKYITRIFRDGHIEYVLVGTHSEDTFLRFSVSN